MAAAAWRGEQAGRTPTRWRQAAAGGGGSSNSVVAAAMHGGTIVSLEAPFVILSDASLSQSEQSAHHLRPSPLLLASALDGKETVTQDGRIAKTLRNCAPRAPARPASLPPTLLCRCWACCGLGGGPSAGS